MKLLALLVAGCAQDFAEEEAKELVKGLTEFEAIAPTKEHADELARRYNVLRKFFDTYIWEHESEAAAYEMGLRWAEAARRLALAQEAADQNAEATWSEALLWARRARDLVDLDKALAFRGATVECRLIREYVTHNAGTTDRLRQVEKICDHMRQAAPNMYGGMDGAPLRVELARAKKVLGEPAEAIKELAELVDRCIEQEAPVDAKVIDSLVEQLNDDSGRVREQAAEKLAALGRGAAGALQKLVESDDAELRVRAKMVMDRIGSRKRGPTKEFLDALEEVCDDVPAEEVRRILTLVQEQSPGALGDRPKLRKILNK